MHYITLIKQDQNKNILGSSIVARTANTNELSQLLLDSAQTYLEELLPGTEFKVIQISDEEQIAEPNYDTALIYQIDGEKNKLYFYKRETEVSTGYIYNSYSYPFYLAATLEIAEYSGETKSVIKPKIKEIELKPINPVSAELSQRPMTMVLDELKKSKRFSLQD